MPPVGFEPTISAGERPKTYALDRAATGTGHLNIIQGKITAQGQAINSSKIWKYLNIRNKLRNKNNNFRVEHPVNLCYYVIIRNCIDKGNSEQIKFGKFLLPFFPEYFASLTLSKNIKIETELYYTCCFV